MDTNNNNIDNQKGNLLEKFDVDTYMFNIEKYLPDLNDDNFYALGLLYWKVQKLILIQILKLDST